jgi:hypothetical protein
MATQTQAEADVELQLWYAARTAVRNGKSFTIITSAGTRVVTNQDLKEIQNMIVMFERKVLAPNVSTVTKKGRHDFALVNFNNGALK